MGIHKVGEPKKEKAFREVLNILNFDTIRTPDLTDLGTQKGVIRDMAKELPY